VDEKRLVRRGEEFDSADLEAGLLEFDVVAAVPEPDAGEAAEPWATGKAKLRERVRGYVEHLRHA
jgi:hypothetical protein